VWRLLPLRASTWRLCDDEVGALDNVIVISVWSMFLSRPCLQGGIGVVRMLLGIRGVLIPDLVAEMDLGLNCVRVDHRDSFGLFCQEGIWIYRWVWLRA
jgi:hypothetical protein